MSLEWRKDEKEHHATGYVKSMKPPDPLPDMLSDRCGTCRHFIGGGDWNLCCDLPHPDCPCGFLCDADTLACEKYERDENAE